MGSRPSPRRPRRPRPRAAPRGPTPPPPPPPAARATGERRLEITAEALRKIIREYTREAGVRNLEREIGAICRKVARKVASGEVERATVDAADIATYLGPERFARGLAGAGA